MPKPEPTMEEFLRESYRQVREFELAYLSSAPHPSISATAGLIPLHEEPFAGMIQVAQAHMTAMFSGVRDPRQEPNIVDWLCLTVNALVIERHAISVHIREKEAERSNRDPK